MLGNFWQAARLRTFSSSSLSSGSERGIILQKKAIPSLPVVLLRLSSSLPRSSPCFPQPLFFTVFFTFPASTFTILTFLSFTTVT
ncbi:hypothetical protein CDL15_Pgr008152 [Punica granatum]|uniref:Uncharacterized protein n=1 Tax=Punica granatum TaxID=22663 RepID=A0A218VTJ8_PUNGR|nr:hypothetical protein CDL15_Pgr008152 [Punica granatum]